MKITEQMLVPEPVKDDGADVRKCNECGEPTFFVPQSVLVMSPSGARKMRLWACEKHPLPETITDQPDED